MNTISFREWYYLEAEGGMFATKKHVKAKNGKEYDFINIYGNTRPSSDKLKTLGLRYGFGMWSLPVNMLTPELQKGLEEIGVDFSRLNAESAPSSSEPIVSNPQSSESKSDQILSSMKKDVDGALESAGRESSKIRDLLNNIDKMIEQVANSTDEASKQEFIKNFLEFSSKFYNYSMHNQWLIYIQTKGRASHVAGATQWPEKGRQVSKWNEAIIILRPNPVNMKDKATKQPLIDPNTGQPRKMMLFAPVKVYDVSATEPIPGHPSPFAPISRKEWSKDSNESREEVESITNALVDWIKEKNIDVDVEKDMNPEVGGYSAGGKIRINDTFKGINYFSTLVHEAAHELLHWMLDAKGAKLTTDSKKEKEIDAETTAYVVLKNFGFETLDAPNYLALFRATGDDIRKRRSNVQKAAKEIINGIHEKIGGQIKEPEEPTEETPTEWVSQSFSKFLANRH